MKHNDIGIFGEDVAAKLLKKKGYKIIGRNVHMSHNEIDVIAKNKTFLVFAEVKTRTVDSNLSSPYGTPAEAVNKAKQLRVIKAATDYIRLNPKKVKTLQPRFDVIEVYVDKTGDVLKTNHFEDAFYLN